MGLLGSLFSSSSASSTRTETTNNVTDLRAGAEGGGSAISNPQFDGNLIVGSEEVAALSISESRAASENALTQSFSLIDKVFTGVLNSVDRSQDKAAQNVAAANNLAKDIIAEEQEGANDQLIQIVQIGLIAGVIVVALKSGALKDIKGVFK
jgi:hypothetical protein